MRTPMRVPWAKIIPRSNVGQVAHVSPTPWDTSQEADITRRALEAACWLQLWCWKSCANSHPCPGVFNRRILRSCLVPQCSHRLIDPAINDALRIVTGWLDACVLRGQPSHPRGHPTCWASSQWSHTVSSTPCHGVWTPAPFSDHLYIECKCTAPQVETPICTRRTTADQLIWQQHAAHCAYHQRSAEWADLLDSVLSSPTPAPPQNDPSKKWVRLNRLRTDIGRFRSCMYKWGMASSAACECGAEEQTADHVVFQRPIHRLPYELHVQDRR